MPNTKEILARLRTLREEKDLRQGYIARRLGIDRTTYVRKEQGIIPITTEEWIKLAEAMGKDLSYFFSLSSPVFNKNEIGAAEMLLLKLYRSLSPEERYDLICGINLLLKNVRRKETSETLEMLRKV